MPVGADRWDTFLSNTSQRDVGFATFDEYRDKDTTKDGRSVGTVGAAPPPLSLPIKEIRRQAKEAEAKLLEQRAKMDAVLGEERARVEAVRTKWNADEAEKQRRAEQKRRNNDPNLKMQRMIRQQAAVVARRRERAKLAEQQVEVTRASAVPFGVAFDAQRLEENLRAAEYALEAAAAARERRRERARAMARGEDVDDGFGGAGTALLMTFATADMKKKGGKKKQQTPAELRRAERRRRKKQEQQGKKRKKAPTWGSRAGGGEERLPRLAGQAHDRNTGRKLAGTVV